MKKKKKTNEKKKREKSGPARVRRAARLREALFAFHELLVLLKEFDREGFGEARGMRGLVVGRHGFTLVKSDRVVGEEFGAAEFHDRFDHLAGVGVSREPAFSDMKVYNYQSYTKDCFSCEVSFDLQVSYNSGSFKDYPTHMEYIFVKRSGKWYIADMVMLK